MWIVLWKSYGVWRQTSTGWPTQREAERHADLHLRTPGKDYYEHVTVRWIDLPNGEVLHGAVR